MHNECTLLSYTCVTSRTYFLYFNAKFLESIIQKIFIHSETTDLSFSNCEYFFTYKKYQHKFQTDYREILAEYWYSDVVFRLA